MKLIRRDNLMINGEPVPETGVINIETSSEGGVSQQVLQEVTYAELLTMKSADTLMAGTFYSFDHYHRNYYNFSEGSNLYNDPSPERFVVQALSNSVLSAHLRSVAFPQDEIEYSFEGGSNPMGIVIKRVDTLSNITMFLDWRKARFWNYKYSELVNVFHGGGDHYTNIYIGRDSGYGMPEFYPVIFSSYTSQNVHINQVESPLYIDTARDVRIDRYIAETYAKTFVSMNNLQVNSLFIDAHQDVLNEVLINDVVSCVVNIDNNTGASITVSNQINPTITIPEK